MSYQATNTSSGAEDIKGKGKSPATHEEMSMDEAEDDSESDEDQAEEPEEDDEDNMDQISSENIVSGGRDRKQVDYAKAAAEADDLDEDEDDDEDFQAPEEDNDKMEE